jgi:hypothetical protein
MAGQGSDTPLEDLIQTAIDSAEDDKVTIGSLLDAFGSRSFGPLIALFALIAIIPPISGIPGVPTTMAVLCALVAVQLLFGADHPWVPKFLKKLGTGREKLEKAQARGKAWMAWIDKLVRHRLAWAAEGVAQRIAAACVILAAVAMPPLELLPFAAAAPAAAILMFGVGLMARDGLVMLIGFAATAATAFLVIVNWTSG